MPDSCPFDDAVTRYAWDIVQGVIPAGKWHRLACERHLRDMAASVAGTTDWIFREDLARKAFGLFELFRHYKGDKAGLPIYLEPWQKFIVGSIMGWVHRKTGMRRFRNSFVELVRGSGKSTLAGGLMLIFTFFDGESGAEGYSVATKKDQARISFQYARQMVLRSSAVRQHIEVSKYNLHSEATESKVEALGSDADTLDGLRPHFAVIDEVHKIPNAELIGVVESGMGTRDQPHLFEITTAGSDDNSVYGQHHLLSTRVLEQLVPLDEWFAFIAAADPDDDWTLEETARKASPNWGISIKPDFIRKELRKALANPEAQASYRRWHLGQKTQEAGSYFSLIDWLACPKLPDGTVLRGRPNWIGLDLSSSIDVTCALQLWLLDGDEWAIRPYFWLPSDNIEDRGHRDRVPYALWIQQGWIRVTEGSTIDPKFVRKQVAEIAKDWKTTEVCADPWQMNDVGPWLDEQGVKVMLVPQRFEKLSPAMKLAQAKILERRIRHDHNPLMNLMVNNVTPRTDENGNVLPSKKRSRGRIDGVQAWLNVIAQLPSKAAPTIGMFFLGGKR